VRSDLIVSVGCGSDGSRCLGAEGRRWVAGAQLPWRRFAGDTRPGVPGDDSRRDQAREVQHNTGNLAGRLWRRFWARLGQNDGEGGSGRQTLPASGVPVATASQTSRQLALKHRGGNAMLTRGLWRPELRRKEENDDDRR
jgi:hypothetical protein